MIKHAAASAKCATPHYCTSLISSLSSAARTFSRLYITERCPNFMKGILC